MALDEGVVVVDAVRPSSGTTSGFGSTARGRRGRTRSRGRTSRGRRRRGARRAAARRRAPLGRCRRARPGRRGCAATALRRYGAGPAARSATTGAGAVGGRERVADRLLGERADVAERQARAATQETAVDLAAERRAPRRCVGVDVVHERPGLEAVRDSRPAGRRSPGHPRARRPRAPRKRHARGEEAGSSRCRSAKVGWAASGGMRVQRDLGELADPVQLVGVGGRGLAPSPAARSRSCARRGRRPRGPCRSPPRRRRSAAAR